MVHHPTERAPQEDHYAVGQSGMGPWVLAQLQSNGEQVRVPLTPREARHFAMLLLKRAEVLEHGPVSLD